jgi:hypothetical protein
MRVTAWVIGLVIGIALSLVMARLRAPDMPIALQLMTGVIAGAVGGAFFDRALRASREDLVTARLGTPEAKQARASVFAGSMLNKSTRALVAIEAGDLERAAELMNTLIRADRRRSLSALLDARYALACGDESALDRLLGWQLRIRPLIASEIERYHAYAVACALHDRPTDPRTRAAAKRLLAHRDAEVRAYGVWLAVHDDDAPPSRDLTRAAALARAASLLDLAKSIETLAAKLASASTSVPYRR